ncbi:hypothetical protein KQ247_12625 [Ruegeria pomeroyi]|uniref:Uncharacterized protein n=2 Tax=Ruegeria pomeroyi TaxID=89184 RepID=Q5LVB2_RUEPO|nr:hypothetical protein [Ruegeria pomeroyi]HCE72339.1 hypothetical protein [Ruegeria sp.]AAV94095.1 hypothetical protein SPO0790 [Ruegeria pomeroyi DSS-3]NVK98781.1 hypothetical protein [Ruegeria pomeroyi]NVL00724.1 hypothetical protein [Ruegeria pomeroyi]QWV07679.1 hypothetical protein KQ247_12625 [Ruegeria pomeroyi]
MSAAVHRGGAAVGHLADLPTLEASAVHCLRLWSDATEGRAALPEGRSAELLKQICGLCASYGRRPLMRHGLGCACLGADEACFAHMVAAAATGAREDALMLAALIVRPDLAPALVALSEQLGLALHRRPMVGAAQYRTLESRAGRLH